LLPALNRARQQGNLVKCQANLRSLGQALLIYTNEYKGSLPFGDYSVPASSAHKTRWYMQVQAILDSKAGISHNDEAAAGGNPLREAMMCPEVPGGKNTTQGGVIHYMCHPKLMPDTNGPLGANSKPYKIARIRRSSEIALLFDCPLVQETAGEEAMRVRFNVAVANHIDKGAMYSPGDLSDDVIGPTLPKKPEDSIDMTPQNPAEPNSDTLNNTQTIRFRHRNNKIANVLMADGHVESFQYNTGPAANDPNKTSFKRKNVYVNK
jgi:prepilin-type processing-associated H-X9-DG protein